MSEIILDRAISKNIRHRIGRAASIKIKFRTVDQLPYSINGQSFEFFLRKRKDENTKLLLMTVGAGLTITGDDDDELNIPITKELANQLVEHTYFWQVVNTTRSETWFNGDFIAHAGKFHAAADTEITATINLGEIIIEATISLAGVVTTAQIVSAINAMSDQQKQQLATLIAPYLV